MDIAVRNAILKYLQQNNIDDFESSSELAYELDLPKNVVLNELRKMMLDKKVMWHFTDYGKYEGYWELIK